MNAMTRLVETDAVTRLLAHDTTLFSVDTGVQEEIAGTLGWLHLASDASEVLPRMTSLVEEVRAEGVTDVVLLGMGGSSLASLVIATIMGGAGSEKEIDGALDSGASHAQLHVLDTVAPRTIARVLAEVDPARAIYLVASKSGGTIEPNSLLAVFAEAVRDRLGEPAAGGRFIALTDPGTSLEEHAREHGFRAIVPTPVDVGGRFSALSAFGLLPAALAGIDVPLLVTRAQAAESACASPATSNPAALLATFMIDAAEMGADKLTIVAPERLRTFGLWVEQLVAESLGKQGTGIVPVVELTEQPRGYGKDRAVVVVREADDEPLASWAATAKVAHPVFEIVLGDAYDIAGEFVRWEYATALAGALLGVNPFDQPSVAEAKAATAAILDGTEAPLPPDLAANDVTITFAGALTAPDHPDRSVHDAIHHAIETLGADDYLALLAYLPDDDDLTAPLREAVSELSASTGRAACFELGPRYLHSTGQLHKGGPDTGVFIVVTTKDTEDIAVPGRPWGLRKLHRAQAQGDVVTLAHHGRRVLALDLPDTLPATIAELATALAAAGARYPARSR